MEVTFTDMKDINLNNIIDIRENYVYNLCKIKGSRNIPYEFLIFNPADYLNKNEKYYILCDNGHKSRLLSEILNSYGYHTFSIKGVINEYLKNK